MTKPSHRQPTHPTAAKHKWTRQTTLARKRTELAAQAAPDPSRIRERNLITCFPQTDFLVGLSRAADGREFTASPRRWEREELAAGDHLRRRALAKPRRLLQDIGISQAAAHRVRRKSVEPSRACLGLTGPDARNACV